MSGFVVDVAAVAVGGTVGVAIVVAIGVAVAVAVVIAIVIVTIGFRLVVVVVVVVVVFAFIFVVVLGGLVWTIVGDVSFGGVDARGRTVISGYFCHFPVKVDVWHEVGVSNAAEIGCFW